MTDIIASMKTADAYFTGFDILARAQFMEGFAGIVPANAKLRGKTSNPALLAFIEETAMELSPSISPSWWDKGEMSLFRPAYKLAERLGSRHGLSGHDVMQDEFANVDADGKPKDSGSIFYAAGRYASRGGRWATGIKSGALKPADLQGLVKNFASKSMINEIEKRVRQRELDEEQASLIGEETSGIGGFDESEWSMITGAIFDQPNNPISQKFFVWLQGMVEDMPSEAGRVMNVYLQSALSGDGKSDKEIAAELGKNPAYLSLVKKQFAEMAAEG
jgi:hypothetical protein